MDMEDGEEISLHEAFVTAYIEWHALIDNGNQVSLVREEAFRQYTIARDRWLGVKVQYAN